MSDVFRNVSENIVLCQSGGHVYCKCAKENQHRSGERGKKQITLTLINTESSWRELDEERHSIRT